MRPNVRATSICQEQTRWLVAIGTAVVAGGYLLLGQTETFTQFAFVRLTLVTWGDAMMGSMVVNVIVAQWLFLRRGRALALTGMGVGFAKVCMPIVAASLILWLGWRQTWVVFGCVILVLVVGSSLRHWPGRKLGLAGDYVGELFW